MSRKQLYIILRAVGPFLHAVRGLANVLDYCSISNPTAFWVIFRALASTRKRFNTICKSFSLNSSATTPFAACLNRIIRAYEYARQFAVPPSHDGILKYSQKTSCRQKKMVNILLRRSLWQTQFQVPGHLTSTIQYKKSVQDCYSAPQISIRLNVLIHHYFRSNTSGGTFPSSHSNNFWLVNSELWPIGCNGTNFHSVRMPTAFIKRILFTYI
jgi:hypothetical protein